MMKGQELRMPPSLHGGRRTGAGRPPAYREPLVRATVTLPASYTEQLRSFGQGNLSDGIRRLVEEARLPSGAFWYALPAWAQPPSADPSADPSSPQAG